MFKTALIIIGLTITSFHVFSQKVIEPNDTPAEWSKSYKPFCIAGNLYYVGTYDLACYLITTNKGNILINTGLANSLSIINNNIKALGFKVSDTKILLTTQAHYDHMGAMADFQKLTNATVMMDKKDVKVAEDGGRSDYALGGNHSSYKPVKVNRLLNDGDMITLGNMKLKMLHHPGHTKGSCSYLFEVKDKNKVYKVLIANLPSIVTDKKFSDIPEYPQIENDYRNTLKKMKALSFDIWLASHASQFNLHTKHKENTPYNPKAFIDRKGYDESLNKLSLEFSKKIQDK
ncbi:subclass B3 metallo-beta-lactamase [Pedobacter jamesrossensis]